MSKRQSDYLSSLLTPQDAQPKPNADADEVPSPSPVVHMTDRLSGSTLLARESALARVAAGEVKQVTQLSLDPARVRIWHGNARHQASLNEESCRDLIDSIVAEGGQKVPAVVRRVKEDPAFDYELIVGTRRHWSITWLRSNNYPEMALLVQVQNLDDESAFRLADVENRARRDVSDFERARNYRDALKAYYGDRQNRMAERLNLSKGWLSKMLTVASVPDWAVAAYATPADIQLKVCYQLAQRLAQLAANDVKALRKVKAEAAELALEQSRLRGAGKLAISAVEVTNRLVAATHDKPSAPDSLFSADSVHGRRALSVQSWNRNGMTIRIHAGSGASREEIMTMVGEALATVEGRNGGQSS